MGLLAELRVLAAYVCWRRRSSVSLEQAEEVMKKERDAAASLGSAKLAPKSLREAAVAMASENKVGNGCNCKAAVCYYYHHQDVPQLQRCHDAVVARSMPAVAMPF